MKKLFRVLGKRGRITIPYEIRERMNFSYNDVLSFTEADDDRTVIVKREKICDSCGEAQPQMIKDDEVTLFDFLSNLSADQQRAALVHLSVLWAEHQVKGGCNNV